MREITLRFTEDFIERNRGKSFGWIWKTQFFMRKHAAMKHMEWCRTKADCILMLATLNYEGETFYCVVRAGMDCLMILDRRKTSLARWRRARKESYEIIKIDDDLIPILGRERERKQRAVYRMLPRIRKNGKHHHSEAELGIDDASDMFITHYHTKFILDMMSE